MYKFDFETRKYVIAQERSPTRGTVVKTAKNLTAAQLEKRRDERKMIDAAAMKLLTPSLIVQNVAPLTDLTQIIPPSMKRNK